MSSILYRWATFGFCSLLLAGLQTWPSLAQPLSLPSYGDPLASYQIPTGIGREKAIQDRAELRRYQGDPAAQAILRQQRHNLCRNVPEAC